jgi:hypothetical protein
MTPTDAGDGPGNGGSPDGLMGIDLKAVGDVRPGEVAVRFAFGAAISVLAGLVSLGFGPRAGGMFLAFPAILPATLTLIERREGTRVARHDLSGSVLGAVGLMAFALVGVVTLGRLAYGVALLAALVAWAVMAVLAYLLWTAVRRATGAEAG